MIFELNDIVVVFRVELSNSNFILFIYLFILVLSLVNCVLVVSRK